MLGQIRTVSQVVGECDAVGNQLSILRCHRDAIRAAPTHNDFMPLMYVMDWLLVSESLRCNAGCRRIRVSIFSPAVFHNADYLGDTPGARAK